MASEDPAGPRARTVLAELYLMQHTCHWFCRSRTVASMRLLARHKTAYEQVLQSVAPATLKDKLSGKDLEAAKEVFVLEFHDGTRLKASRMKATGFKVAAVPAVTASDPPATGCQVTASRDKTGLIPGKCRVVLKCRIRNPMRRMHIRQQHGAMIHRAVQRIVGMSAPEVKRAVGSK